MLTPEEDLEITSLSRRGWTISAIARHVGHDRKTVRAYLSGVREAGVRERVEPDSFEEFEPYVRQRFVDDPHVRPALRRRVRLAARPQSAVIRPSSAKCAVVALGYPRSYLVEQHRRPHTWTSSTRRVWRFSGTGSSLMTRRGAPRRTCWSVRWRARPVPGLVLRGGRPGPSGGRDRRDPAPARRHREALACRPHGHRRQPEQRPDPTVVRTGRQALRRRP